MGPQGPEGPQGPSGTSLLTTYTGIIPVDGDFLIDVPEIVGRQAETFILAYWTTADVQHAWLVLSDGWNDSTHYLDISWDLGQVILRGMVLGDIYLMNVYEVN